VLANSKNWGKVVYMRRKRRETQFIRFNQEPEYARTGLMSNPLNFLDCFLISSATNRQRNLLGGFFF
jgi:hypothetical protein